MGIDLSLAWAIIILFGLMMYVVMDGFDLGIGLLFLHVHNEQDRDIMMNTVAPVWDGNETWLVLGGAGLFAAFPLAYAVVLEALAIPLIVMLLGLIFRGVAFEFRFKASPSDGMYGIKLSLAARCWQRQPRALHWVLIFKVSLSTALTTAEERWIG